MCRIIPEHHSVDLYVVLSGSISGTISSIIVVKYRLSVTKLH